MTKQFFNCMKICACIEQMSGPDSYREMAKCMSAESFVLIACLLHRHLHIKLNASRVHTLPLFRSFKQISDRAVLAEVFPKGP